MLWKLPEFKLQPEVIFRIPGINFPITNTLLCTWISIVVLVLLFYFGTRRRDLIPSGLQNALEWVVEYLLGLVEGVAGKEKGKKFFPLVASLFTFILVSNLLDVFPGVDTIGWIKQGEIDKLNAQLHTHYQPVLGFLLIDREITDKLVSWIRPATSDLNLTLAMALIVVVTCQVFGFYTLGAKEHLVKYINWRALRRFNIIEFFVGVIEIVSELSRILSFAFRLFGNIFAGGAVLAVFAFLIPFFGDVVFIPLELFVAVVQALVFALLTLVFLEIATTSHEHAEGEHKAREETESKKAVTAH